MFCGEGEIFVSFHRNEINVSMEIFSNAWQRNDFLKKSMEIKKIVSMEFFLINENLKKILLSWKFF